MVPAVTCVEAVPAASVLTDDGATVNAPVVLNVTSTFGTGVPLASVSFTEKVPAAVATLTLAEGDVATVRRAGGPGGRVDVDESEPQAAATASAAIIGNARKLRDSITLS
jgi:hypothetical protein